ncbi:unnamed protein product [Caenorhabditis angaria]|uniref:PLD phosphodiesterase domain-containing protein n=1 Tax=Caenorhabditis angaria TaxID=860376 RepID=A0A9P1I9X5_9PELO|nr:unnamed protein product [Caenorhabditis angaria]
MPSSVLPTTDPPNKSSKTSSKLPIYLVSAIVIVLVIAVVLINFFHRTTPPTSELVNSSTIIPLSAISSTTSSSSSSSQESDETENPENLTEVTISIETTQEPTTSTEADTTTVIFETSTVVPIEETSTVTFETSTVSLETSTVTFETSEAQISQEEECSKTCSIQVVETIPRDVHFSSPISTRNSFESWAEMLSEAEREIDIFAYKMNLRGSELRYDVDNSTTEGKMLYGILESKARNGVDVKLIDCQPPTNPINNLDAEELEKLGLIERHGLDMNTLNGGGGGIQHSKTFIVDDRHLFVGSQNFEWKSFSQKLEIGLQIMDCPCLALQASQLFDEYFRYLSGNDTFQPVEFAAVQIRNSSFQFLASPSVLLKSSESWDFEKLLNLIYEAKESVDIAVMQYFPSWIYFKKQEFFSPIDDAIRMSLSRGVRIRIIVSGDDEEEQKLMFTYLHSLQVLDSPGNNRNIQVKFLTIPQTAQESYKDRKLHAKFIVSETQTLIGSSNYAPEYFYKSSGTAILISEMPFIGEYNQQLRAVFNRYWSSKYTQTLQKFGESRGFLPTSPKNPISWLDFDHILFSNEKYVSTKVVVEKNKPKKDEESGEVEYLSFN